MELSHGAQTTYQIGYHMVWGVKYCHHVLNNTMKEFLVTKTKEVCEAYEYQYMCIGIAPNHVHLFVGAPPKVAPAQIAQRIKSITVRELYLNFPQLKRQLYGGAIWTDWVSDIGSVTSRTGDDSNNPTLYRYLQVKATLSNTDGASTPTIDSYDIDYHTEVKPSKPTAQTAVTGN